MAVSAIQVINDCIQFIKTLMDEIAAALVLYISASSRFLAEGETRLESIPGRARLARLKQVGSRGPEERRGLFTVERPQPHPAFVVLDTDAGPLGIELA